MPKGSLPKDPRDHYVRSEKPISLKTLAKIYKSKKSCSYSVLKDRSRGEGWVEQRDEFHRKATAQADHKIIEKRAEYKAKTITELNAEHDAIVQDLLALSKAILRKNIKTDEKGQEVPNIDLKDFRALATTQIELMKAQRLFHNYDPVNPIPQGNARKGNALEKLFEAVLSKENPE